MFNSDITKTLLDCIWLKLLLLSLQVVDVNRLGYVWSFHISVDVVCANHGSFLLHILMLYMPKLTCKYNYELLLLLLLLSLAIPIGDAIWF